jgi:molybdopterin converting factor small subunit
MRKVTVKLFASLAEHLPHDAKDSATISSTLAEFSVPEELCHLVLLNGIFISPSQRKTTAIADGDVVSVWPPVSGG